MNILVINAYSVKNFGDAAIVSCIVQHLRRVAPGCRLQVMSSFDDDNRSFCDRLGVESTPAVWKIQPGGSYLSQYLRGWRLMWDVLRGRAAANPLSEADLVVSLGGGYLYSSTRGPLGLSLMNCLFHIWLAQRLGKPTLLFPQSIGPMLWRIDRWLVRRVLRSVRAVLTREHISTEYIASLRLPPATECPDMAFALEPADVRPLEAAEVGRGPRIGVTVLNWQFAIRGSMGIEVEDYLYRLQMVLEHVRQRHPDLHVFVFPQVCVTSSFSANDDRPISQRLVDRIASFATLVSTSDLACPEELAGRYQQMDAFIGSRMHSAIFAICGGVPTIGLAYQPKTTGTWQLLGLEDWVFDIDRFQMEEIETLLLEMLSHRQEHSRRVQTKVAAARAAVIRLIDAPLAEMLSSIPKPHIPYVAESTT